MKIIKAIAYESGSRPALQDWTFPTLPEGYAWCPDNFVEVFYSTHPAGFVNIIVENDTVTEMTINHEALDAYIAEHPDQPEPVEPETEDTVWDAMAAAITEGVNEV